MKWQLTSLKGISYVSRWDRHVSHDLFCRRSRNDEFIFVCVVLVQQSMKLLETLHHVCLTPAHTTTRVSPNLLTYVIVSAKCSEFFTASSLCVYQTDSTDGEWLISSTRMWANAQRDGCPAEHRWRPLFNAAKFGWCPLLVPCSNAAKTQNQLKFAGVPQTNETISAASGPKFTILWGHAGVKFFSNCRYMP